MCGTRTGTGVQVMRIVRETTDVRGSTCRWWGRRVAFPRSESFDVVEAGGILHPFDDMFYTKHPDVTTRKNILQEFFHHWKQTWFRYFGAVFNWVSKVIWLCFTTLCDWFKKLSSANYSTNQMQNQNQSRLGSHAFSRAWRRLRVFALNSHWFVVLFTFVVIGHCDCFGFGFTTLNR